MILNERKTFPEGSLTITTYYQVMKYDTGVSSLSRQKSKYAANPVSNFLIVTQFILLTVHTWSPGLKC